MLDIKIAENTFFAWMDDVFDEDYLKMKCGEEEPVWWKIYWLDDSEQCIYSYSAIIFVKTASGKYYYLDLYYYAYEDRSFSFSGGPFETTETMKTDYDKSPPSDFPFPEDLIQKLSSLSEMTS